MIQLNYFDLVCICCTTCSSYNNCRHRASRGPCGVWNSYARHLAVVGLEMTTKGIRTGTLVQVRRPLEIEFQILGAAILTNQKINHTVYIVGMGRKLIIGHTNCVYKKICRHCPRTVYVGPAAQGLRDGTVSIRLSVHLSLPAWVHSSESAAAGLLLWARQARDIDQLLGQRQRMRAVPRCQRTQQLKTDWFHASINVHDQRGCRKQPEAPRRVQDLHETALEFSAGIQKSRQFSRFRSHLFRRTRTANTICVSRECTPRLKNNNIPHSCPYLHQNADRSQDSFTDRFTCQFAIKSLNIPHTLQTSLTLLRNDTNYR